MKKFDIQNLIKKFKDYRCTLLTKEYLNSKQKVCYSCDICNEINYVIVNAWNKKQNKCNNCRRIKNSEITLNKFKESLHKESYSFVSGKCIDTKSDISVECNNNHIYQTNYNRWTSSKDRCPKCKGGIKFSFDQFKLKVKNLGFTVVSYIYINSKTRMLFKCSEGHIVASTFGNLRDNHSCKTCINLNYYNKLLKSMSEVGYKLLSKSYKGYYSKVDYRCDKYHKHSIEPDQWYKGIRCPYCSGVAKKTLCEVKEYIESVGYILVSDKYINCTTKLHLKCDKNHDYMVSWDHFSGKGSRCPECIDHGTSKFEKEVKGFVLNLNQKIIENDRSTILNHKTRRFLELDILLPCKTKAIECNGYYWHSLPEVVEKDKIKKKQCKDKNIDLLIIEELNWYNNKEKQKIKIKDFIYN